MMIFAVPFAPTPICPGASCRIAGGQPGRRCSLGIPLRSQGAPLFEREEAFPIVLHADHSPAVLRGLGIEFLGKGADLGVGQSVALDRTRILAARRRAAPASSAAAVAGSSIFQHLPVPGRIAERRARPASDFQMNALGLAGIVVVQQQLGSLVRNGLPSLS